MKYIPPLNGDVNDPDRSYIDADPASGVEGSIPPAASIENPQREIVNAITAAGLTPDDADLTQLTAAIQALGKAQALNVASNSGAPVDKPGVIVPLYKYVDFWGDADSDGTQNIDDPDWWFNQFIDQLTTTHGAEVIVILNPENGPGSVLDQNWTQAITWIKATGARVIGYVMCGYGQRPVADITADVDRWYSLYPSIDGIFLDEFPNGYSNDLQYIDAMKAVADHARDTYGAWPLVANPGTSMNNDFYKNNCADIFIIYENAALPSEIALRGNVWEDTHRWIPYAAKGSLVMGQAEISEQEFEWCKRYTKWIYWTDDTLDNPWDSVSSYFGELLARLDWDWRKYLGGSTPATTPVGGLMMWSTDTAPTGWLLCDGRAVSRTTYADLFGVIGTTHGAGDGSTTFNLPDLRGRSPLGANHAGLPGGADATLSARNIADRGGEEAHTLTEAEMPSHTHAVTGYSGPQSGGDLLSSAPTDGTQTVTETTSAAGGGAAHNNMPPYAVVNFVIYAGA